PNIAGLVVAFGIGLAQTVRGCSRYDGLKRAQIGFVLATQTCFDTGGRGHDAPTNRFSFAALLVGTDGMAPSVPRALTCTFSVGYTSSFEADWTSKTINDQLDITFAAIDVLKGQAQMIGDLGASDITVFDGISLLHFIESTAMGNQNFTTAFLKKSKNGAHPAVHSR